MNNLGWECPKCHHCYAPTNLQCINCNAPHEAAASRQYIPGYAGTWMNTVLTEMGSGSITNIPWPQNAHSTDTALKDK